jgi:hypothetical protein
MRMHDDDDDDMEALYRQLWSYNDYSLFTSPTSLSTEQPEEIPYRFNQ